jgi:hypothetical protein
MSRDLALKILQQSERNHGQPEETSSFGDRTHINKDTTLNDPTLDPTPAKEKEKIVFEMFLNNEGKNEDYKGSQRDNYQDLRRTKENIDDFIGGSARKPDGELKTNQTVQLDSSQKDKRMKILSGKTQYRPSIDVDEIGKSNRDCDDNEKTKLEQEENIVEQGENYVSHEMENG